MRLVGKSGKIRRTTAMMDFGDVILLLPLITVGALLITGGVFLYKDIVFHNSLENPYGVHNEMEEVNGYSTIVVVDKQGQIQCSFPIGDYPNNWEALPCPEEYKGKMFKGDGVIPVGGET